MQLDDRIARYYPILFRLYPTPARRPCPRELFIESYRLGQIDKALGILKKIHREITEQVIGYLSTTDEGNSMHEKERSRHRPGQRFCEEIASKPPGPN
jgi:hypothetical protein